VLSIGAVGCSDSVRTKEDVTPTEVGFALSPGGLPNCNASKNGKVWYVWSPASFYVCNGATGTWVETIVNGLSAAVRVSADPESSVCPNGGSVIQFGLDHDRDGILDDSEVAASASACNGSVGPVGATGLQGPQGIAGLNALVAIDLESSGSNCSSGGVQLRTGLDQNGDGELSESETTQRQYVCNGVNSNGTGGAGGTGGSGGAPNQIVLVPVDDRTAYADDYNSNFVGLRMADEPELYAFAASSLDTQDAYRAILEFELPQVLQGKQLVAAELFFETTSASGSPEASGFKVYGFAGNGIVDLADGERIENQIGGILSMWDTYQRVDVTEFLTTFDLASLGFPAFVIRGYQGQAGLYSSEAFTDADRPALTITYDD
jgi:hypothetical protein